MYNKSVSVIIPTYNRAHFICEAIDSVLQQDIKDCLIEIIVIDDGSTDYTREVLRRYGDKIKYVSIGSGGAGRARNIGIEFAQCEWISFLDSDDRWLPFKLSLQFRILEFFPEIKVVHSNFYTFDGNEIIIKNGLDYWLKSTLGKDKFDWSDIYFRKFNSSQFLISHNGRQFDIYSGNIFSSLLVVSCVSCITALVHSSCLKGDVRFAEDFPTWEDYWFFCKLAENNDFLFIDVPTAENRSHSGTRLTIRPNPIDPLNCHLITCNEVFTKSKSISRPPSSRIQDKCKNIHISLMKEYLKIGQINKAREMRKCLDDMGGVEQDLKGTIYYLSSFLPFNYVNRLVGLKNRLTQLRTALKHRLSKPVHESF